MNSPSIPPFHLDKSTFRELKKELGDDVLQNTMAFMAETLWCSQNQTGTEFKESERIVKIDINLPNETIHVDFYADKFLKDNLYKGYKNDLNSLTKTQKASLEVTVKKCVERFKEKEFKTYGEMIKDAENIKSLKDSAVLKVIAYGVLQQAVWNHAGLTHLCNDKYYKNWA